MIVYESLSGITSASTLRWSGNHWILDTSRAFRLGQRVFSEGARAYKLERVTIGHWSALNPGHRHPCTNAGAEAYRRDRRKDILLQENGYLVLRFLAEDVESAWMKF